MDPLFVIFGIMMLIGILVFAGFWFTSKNMNFNYETDYRANGGRRKHYKHKFVEKPYMSMKINTVLAFIAAYIVYTMFYNY